MKIAFHSNQLGLRGTEVALYDYAKYNKLLLNNDSIIFSSKNLHLHSLKKFQSEFEVFLYNDFNECTSFSDKEGVDCVYFIKAGFNDGKLVPGRKNIVHAVFQNNNPHGDRYAYVSRWLSNKMSSGSIPYVPHIVDIMLYNHGGNLRSLLNIPDDAVVFGYYGGENSFNIGFVKKAIQDITNINSNIYFIFMNITKFCENRKIMFLPGSYDMKDKISFINTCDACLHARDNGESFGLTIAEFSVMNKPIVTYLPEENILNFDSAHLDQLQNNGIYYSNYQNLLKLLSEFNPTNYKNIDLNYYKEFSPSEVMGKFKKVFLV